MIALVLAAGRGERLQPLTDDIPKPMLSIAGKPILQYNIELLADAAVERAIVNLHHHPEVIEGYFGDGRAYGIGLSYAYERELLGTAGTARALADQLRGGDFLVVYGDNLSTIDLRKLVALHRSRGADLTMALYRRDDPHSSGIAEVDGDGRITRFLEKPQKDDVFSQWVNAGYYVVSPSVLDAIPTGTAIDFGRDVLPALLARGSRMYGYQMTEGLWWIDTPADYERTRAAFDQGSSPPGFRPAGNADTP